MSLLIKYAVECDCGGTLQARAVDLDQDPGQREVEINLDLLGDMILSCDECDDAAYVPDIGCYITDVED